MEPNIEWVRLCHGASATGSPTPLPGALEDRAVAGAPETSSKGGQRLGLGDLGHERVKIVSSGVDFRGVTSHRGARLLTSFATVSALVLPLALTMTSPMAGASGVVHALQLVSTPDDPFVGGRSFDLASPSAVIVTQNDLSATFQRFDSAGTPLVNDPAWVVSIDAGRADPSGTFLLDRSSTSLRLGNHDGSATEWMGDSACPDLTGEVTFPEVVRDAGGTVTSLSASFALRCTPDDAIYGSFAYNAALPPMPISATDLALTDGSFPSVRGGIPPWTIDPDEWDGMALRVVGDDVLARWDWRDGFRCAEVRAHPIGGWSESPEYVGFDDTMRMRFLDSTRSYWITAGFGWTADLDGCQGGGGRYLGSVQALVHALSVSVEPSPDVTFGDSTRVQGSVQVTPEGPSGPRYDAENVRVELWAKTPEGSERIGTTTSGSAGRWRIDALLSRRSELTVVVEPGRGGWGVRWPHFGTRSDAFVVDVAHDVSAWVSDTTLRMGEPAVISARLRPTDDTLPLYLERRTSEGDWIRVDTAVSTSDDATQLRLPSTRRGWQALRVVAPNDGWHQRGVSNRLRVFGY